MNDREARLLLIERGHWHTDAAVIVDFLRAHCLSQEQFESTIRGMCA